MLVKFRKTKKKLILTFIQLTIVLFFDVERKTYNYHVYTYIKIMFILCQIFNNISTINTINIKSI